jgi:hypothetical protein
MSVIHRSQFKITTIWPELVNKRLQTVTIRLKESQFCKHNDLISVKGLLQRRVCYFDYDGRNRKTEDQLQFEIMLPGAGAAMDSGLLLVEVKHDYFIFQPRYIGENQAIFEHGFTMVIHQANQAPRDTESSGSTLPVLAELIIARGEGNDILKGPVLFGGTGLKPGLLHCRVEFTDTRMPSSIITGVLHGVISYLNPENARLETEFEQPFNLCLKLPQLTSSQRFLITGAVEDQHWWFDSNTSRWHLELKLNYSWKIAHQTELSLSPAGSSLENRRVKMPAFYQNIPVRFGKIFQMPAGSFPLHELNICKPYLKARLTKKGIILGIEFLMEGYATDNAGQECFFCHPVNDLEFIPEKSVGDLGANVIPVTAEPKIELIRFYQADGYLNVETVINCRFHLYQHHWLDLNFAANPNGYILGQVMKEQKMFPLSGSQILQLRAEPVLVKEFAVSPIKIQTQIQPGWIHISGEFQLGVSYLDQQSCLREDTFPVFFRESFLWDSLQLMEEVELNCSLGHDSYAVIPGNPRQLNYIFLLHLVAESLEKREIPVVLRQKPQITSSQINAKENHTVDHREIQCDLPTITGPARRMDISQFYGLQWPYLELEGEIPSELGKAREIAGGRFSLSRFNYRNTAAFILVEGHLSGEIEYWDSNGYLRREEAGFSFWKCICRSPDINPENHRMVPRLDQFRYTPVNVPAWRKGIIKIQCKLELNPAEEEGVSL